MTLVCSPLVSLDRAMMRAQRWEGMRQRSRRRQSRRSRVEAVYGVTSRVLWRLTIRLAWTFLNGARKQLDAGSQSKSIQCRGGMQR